MPGFCRQCGSPLGEPSRFCQKCGAALGSATGPGPSPASAPAPVVPGPNVVPTVAVDPPAATQKKPLSTGVKVAIAVAVVFFLGVGLVIAGLGYAAHRVSQKLHEVVGDSSASAVRPGSTHFAGDACRFLGKSDVSAAIGVEIVKTETVDGGCSFFAKGDQADMASKHVAAMMAKNGADAQTQKMIQGISGGMFKAFQQEQTSKSSSDGSGTVLVFNYGVDDNAVAQMKVNRAAMQRLGPAGTNELRGIGDEAFVTGDSMLMFRKGDKLVRVMYMSCPCNLDAVIPLARKIAAAL